MIVQCTLLIVNVYCWKLTIEKINIKINNIIVTKPSMLLSFSKLSLASSELFRIGRGAEREANVKHQWDVEKVDKVRLAPRVNL